MVRTKHPRLSRLFGNFETLDTGACRAGEEHKSTGSMFNQPSPSYADLNFVCKGATESTEAASQDISRVGTQYRS